MELENIFSNRAGVDRVDRNGNGYENTLPDYEVIQT